MENTHINTKASDLQQVITNLLHAPTTDPNTAEIFRHVLPYLEVGQLLESAMIADAPAIGRDARGFWKLDIDTILPALSAAMKLVSSDAEENVTGLEELSVLFPSNLTHALPRVFLGITMALEAVKESQSTRARGMLDSLKKMDWLSVLQYIIHGLMAARQQTPPAAESEER